MNYLIFFSQIARVLHSGAKIPLVWLVNWQWVTSIWIFVQSQHFPVHIKITHFLWKKVEPEEFLLQNASPWSWFSNNQMRSAILALDCVSSFLSLSISSLSYATSSSDRDLSCSFFPGSYTEWSMQWRWRKENNLSITWGIGDDL